MWPHSVRTAGRPDSSHDATPPASSVPRTGRGDRRDAPRGKWQQLSATRRATDTELTFFAKQHDHVRQVDVGRECSAHVYGILVRKPGGN
jgi:hypothetical protein